MPSSLSAMVGLHIGQEFADDLLVAFVGEVLQPAQAFHHARGQRWIQPHAQLALGGIDVGRQDDGLRCVPRPRATVPAVATVSGEL